MSNKVNKYKLKLYPLVENEFIGTIRIEEVEDSKSIQTVIILDQSISMKDATRRLTNEILPLALSKLLYKTSQRINLLTYAKTTQHYYITIKEMETLKITTFYGTKMAPAVQRVHSLFQSFDGNKPIRVLSISDGEVQDRQETEKAATILMEFLYASHFSINSQAVRLFTTKSQPDTKALCSLLQINNTTTSHFADIPAEESNETIATKIAELFQSDNFSMCKILKMDKQIILKFPWDASPSLQIILLPGMNVFWLKKVQMSDITIGNTPVQVVMQNPLTLTKFQELIETKLPFILDHIKILKVVGTVAANNSVDLMLKYFETKEDKLAQQFYIGKYFHGDSLSRKKISILLSGIVNDENIANWDSARIAEYLRDTYKKRAKNASSFDQILGHIRNIEVNIYFAIIIFAILFVIIEYKLKSRSNSD